MTPTPIPVFTSVNTGITSSCVQSDIPTLAVFSFEARPEIARIAGILLTTYTRSIGPTPFRCSTPPCPELPRDPSFHSDRCVVAVDELFQGAVRRSLREGVSEVVVSMDPAHFVELTALVRLA